MPLHRPLERGGQIGPAGNDVAAPIGAGEATYRGERLPAPELPAGMRLKN